MSTQFFVKYVANPPYVNARTEREIGPYKFRHEAEVHKRDIQDYAGISDCRIVERMGESHGQSEQAALRVDAEHEGAKPAEVGAT